MRSKTEIQVQDWGLIDYSQALVRQRQLLQGVVEKREPESIIFCSHPPIVTLGRKTSSEDILDWKGETLEVSRGGRATYHGPDQLIVYPILDLNRQGRRAFSPKNIHSYLRFLEKVVILTLKSWKVEATGRPPTGVWIGERKVASIGIAVRQWVTYHGLAIHLDQSQSAFKGIRPCGFSSNIMVSLEEVVGGKVDRQKFTTRLLSHLKAGLMCQEGELQFEADLEI